MRCYDDVGVFPNPEKCPKTVLNVWCKFDMELISDWEHHQEGLEFVLNHIKILCGNEEPVFDYFIKWLAQMIQFPEIKTICPTLISKEGAGKGTLVQLIRRMLGNKKVFETANPSRDVWGDFNEHMANSFFVNLDELSKKDSQDSQGKIKALITNSSLTINNKGMKKYNVESFHRFLATTNNEDPISTKDDDRRNLIIRSSDELIGNKQYFSKLYEYIADDNVVKTFFEYLKSIPDMANFGEMKIPETEHQNNLKELSVSVEERWLKDYVENEKEELVELFSQDIYLLFTTFCKDNGIEYKSNSVKLMVNLRNKVKIGIDKKKTKTSNKTILDIVALRKYFGVGCLINK
jgi:putative DNA primase/helicase